MPTAVTDLADPAIHDWILWMIGNGPEPETTPERFATRCAAAVDPLEIAAALEVNGISHAVAIERYGRGDVFSIAHSIWNRMPHEPVAVAENDWSRQPGTATDLLRGLLHAAPVVLLLALCHSLDTRLERWVLPVAISAGWGLSQGAAHLTAVARVRVRSAVDARIRRVVIVLAAASAIVLTLAASITRGTDPVSFAVALVLPVYMTASAILLTGSGERALATALLPGLATSIAAVALPQGGFGATVVVAGALVSLALVVVRSTRALPSPRGADADTLERHHVREAIAHSAHGTMVGVVAAALVIDRRVPGLDGGLAVMIVSLPLLATLGLMEWHLRTLRSRLGRLADTTTDVAQFRWTARHQATVTLLTYAAMVAIVAVIVGIVADPRGRDLWLFLAAQVLFGATCLVDLCLVAFGQVRRVAAVWVVALLAGTSWIFVDVAPTAVARRDLSPLGGRVLSDVVWHAALLTTVVAFVGLLIHLLTVVGQPRRH